MAKSLKYYAEVLRAEVPHTPIATSAGAEPPLQEDAAKDEAAFKVDTETKLRRIDHAVRGECCLDCVWFVEDEATGKGSKFQPATTGECRRRPPVFRDGSGVMGQWPRVRKWTDVCGDGEVAVDED